MRVSYFRGMNFFPNLQIVHGFCLVDNSLCDNFFNFKNGTFVVESTSHGFRCMIAVSVGVSFWKLQKKNVEKKIDNEGIKIEVPDRL